MVAVIALLTNGLNAQTVFCPEGARWIYYSPGSASPPYEYHYVYTGDTLINGFSDVKILNLETRIAWDETYTEINESKSFFRQSNDSIFHFLGGEFRLMFDLAVQAADTRVVHIDWECAESDTLLIDSLGTMEYQGQQLTTYHFSLLLEDQLDSPDTEYEAYYIGGGKGMYVERLGLMADHPTNLSVNCINGGIIAEYVPASFVCYTDNELAVNYPDTCNRFVGIEEDGNRDYPEIIFSLGMLQIQNAPNSTLHVYNILGKELYQTSVQSDIETIDINHLQNGILMVVVESEESRIAKKVIKSSD